VIAAVAWPPRIGLGTTIKCPRCTTRQRPERYNQVPATHSKRRCGKRPRRLDQVPATHNERRRGKWPRYHDQVPATHNERRRGQKPGRLGQLPATHNERRRGQRPKPMPGIAHVPHYHSALHAPCLVRASFANKQNSTAEGRFFFCVEPESPPCVRKKNPHQHTFSFSSARLK
jgi:hypothetical protein